MIEDKNKNGMGKMFRLILWVVFCIVYACSPFFVETDKGYASAVGNVRECIEENFLAKQVLKEENENLVPYNGKVYHIFFHSLILDSKEAFSSPKGNGYNAWMTTRTEFKRMLPLLYKQGFILVDIQSLATKHLNGKVERKNLYLPKGKKPLVISVDDVNYYKYMDGHGFASRLAVDASGNLTSVVKRDGKEYLDYQGDVFPILDEFVKRHPDFSLGGAKGVVAVTGYEGVFGYRINSLSGKEGQMAKIEALKVASNLKQNGWRIACHSYSHSAEFKDGSITLDKLKTDLYKWKREIGPIVGDSNIFIPPFGYGFSPKSEAFKYIVSQGYHIICPVHKEMELSFGSNYMIHSRLNLDGFTMKKYPERIQKYFFDPSIVIDKTRPHLV